MIFNMSNNLIKREVFEVFDNKSATGGKCVDCMNVFVSATWIVILKCNECFLVLSEAYQWGHVIHTLGLPIYICMHVSLSTGQ